MEAMTNNGRSSATVWFSPYLLAFYAAIIGLLIFAIMAAYNWLHDHLGSIWPVVAPWILTGLALVVFILLTVVGWRVFRTLRTFHLEDKRLAAQADNEMYRAMLTEQALEVKKQTVNLLQYAVSQNDNIDISFGSDGMPSNIKIVRAANVRISEVKEREQIAAKAAPALPAPIFPDPRNFEQINFRPTPDAIYLADSVNGTITEPINRLTHIGLAGPTGGGKTNFTRLLTAQILFCKAEVYLASPNFAPVKLNQNHLEDWRPIMRWLKYPPAQDETDIAKLIESFLRLFEARKKQEQISPRREKDVFLILGEWPGIAKRVPDAPEKVGLLLRESRQYGIHVLTEIQDALVKTTQIDTGMVENLRTGGYFGGDKTTAKRILSLKPGQDITEEGLGKMGALWLRSYTHGLNAARVPLFTNKALYDMLGYPPDPVPDSEIWDNNQIPERYASYTEVETRSVMYREPQEKRIYVMPDLAPNSRIIDATMPDPAGIGRNTGPLINNAVTQPVERSGLVGTPTGPEVPGMGPDDLTLTDEQAEELIRLYSKFGNIKTCLRAMNSGRGLGNRYAKHASYILKNKGEL